VPQGTTLAIGLKKGETFTLYLAPDATWPSGACWFQDALSNKPSASNPHFSLAKGPMYQSEVEFTIQQSETGQIFYDMSSVEGVSGGITMNYTDRNGAVQYDIAMPEQPPSGVLQIVPAPQAGFPTVLSDKNLHNAPCVCTKYDPSDPACNTASCLAGCPGALVDNPCGQHACRAYYAKQYSNPASYCGWLYAQKAETYCWAMDEWLCTKETCGWGGVDQPASCDDVEGLQANTYSCGHGTRLLGKNGTTWWGNRAGCVDKLVNGVPTNPAPKRFGGTIQISFENLPWLHA